MPESEWYALDEYGLYVARAEGLARPVRDQLETSHYLEGVEDVSNAATFEINQPTTDRLERSPQFEIGDDALYAIKPEDHKIVGEVFDKVEDTVDFAGDAEVDIIHGYAYVASSGESLGGENTAGRGEDSVVVVGRDGVGISKVGRDEGELEG